jgi:hypothetical protein
MLSGDPLKFCCTRLDARSSGLCDGRTADSNAFPGSLRLKQALTRRNHCIGKTPYDVFTATRSSRKMQRFNKLRGTLTFSTQNRPARWRRYTVIPVLA